LDSDDELDDWRPWLARHGPGLALFARQWTVCVADAEDAVQDGFVRFWQARGRSRGEGYLYACVRTAAMDLSRSQRRSRRRETRVAIARDPQAGASAFTPAHAELAAAVESALAQLPAGQREVLVMKLWGGLTFAQIAVATGINPNTAASRYRYALQRLQTELAEEVSRD
jgi:RNA polymerase sigma-70 factor, ECF subfamily